MPELETVKYIEWSYFASVLAYTIFTLWGLSHVTFAFKEKKGEESQLKKLFRESADGGSPYKIANVSVFLGSVGLAALFVAIGYW